MITDLKCQAAVCSPGLKRQRLYDGGGLYLEVSPAGSKRWFWKFYPDGKESRLALGSYPEVSLKAARAARDDAKKTRKTGEATRPPVKNAKSRKVDVQSLDVSRIPSALLTIKTACALAGIAPATLYRKAGTDPRFSDPTFPKLVKMGSRCTRIRAGDLTAWLDAQGA